MLIPYGDINPTESRPYVTWALIGLNIAAFLLTIEWLTMAPEARLEAYRTYGALVPNDLEAADFVTSMFLHGSILHLLGNMLFLYITADNIEDEFGHLWFAVFYLFCGISAAVIHLAFVPASSGTPMLGASGAISGVMGAYIVLYPHNRIKIFYWLWVLIGTARIRAVWWLGLWIGFQVLSGATAGASGGGVAYAAHIGGFAVGAAIAYLIYTFGWVEGEEEVEPDIPKRRQF